MVLFAESLPVLLHRIPGGYPRGVRGAQGRGHTEWGTNLVTHTGCLVLLVTYHCTGGEKQCASHKKHTGHR